MVPDSFKNAVEKVTLTEPKSLLYTHTKCPHLDPEVYYAIWDRIVAPCHMVHVLNDQKGKTFGKNRAEKSNC